MIQSDVNVAFIGGGNMAQAIIAGLIRAGHSPKNIMVCAPSAQTRDNLKEKFSVQVNADNSAAVTFADAIFLAVKPNIISMVSSELVHAQALNNRKQLMISVAAGISLSQLQRFTKSDRVVCAMPNLPVSIGQGVIGLYVSPSLTESDRTLTNSLMSGIGTSIWLENEQDMSALIACAGSAPAYFYLFLECMQKSAIAQGLPELEARKAVVETAFGAMSLARQGDIEFSELRKHVTSPKGTTEQGIKTLLNGDLEQLVAQAMSNVAICADQICQENIE